MSTRPWITAFAIAAVSGSACLAQVTGIVKLEGDAPEMDVIDMSGVASCHEQHADPVFQETVVVGDDNELANVVVSIKAEEGLDLGGDTPKEPAVLDQKGCVYTPHVTAMMVGQEMIVKNSDAFMHNVHSRPRQNPAFNFAQPNVDPGRKVESPKVPETFAVNCDVHPWMSAWVRVFDHPFFAVTGEDGKFSIANAPDGEYTLVAWHEKFGEVEQKVEIADGKAEVNFTFKTAAALATPVNEAELASTTGDACGPDACCDKPRLVAGAAGE